MGHPINEGGALSTVPDLPSGQDGPDSSSESAVIENWVFYWLAGGGTNRMEENQSYNETPLSQWIKP